MPLITTYSVWGSLDTLKAEVHKNSRCERQPSENNLNSAGPSFQENSILKTITGRSKLSSDVVDEGTSGVFRQKSFTSCESQFSEALRVARQSIGNISSLLTRRMAGAPQPPPWPNTPDQYDLHKIIGVGATANVYSAHCKARNEKCAIKRINLEKWNTSMDELLKEIQAMSSCNHENVVTYHTSFVVKDELWLVLKLLEGGSLLDIIKHKMRIANCKHGVFDETTIATVLKEVLKGLEYFHSNGQIHRDIKAGNILLGEDGIVQVADFGVSAWLATGRDLSRQRVRHTFVGTPCWMAPEVMEQDHGYDFKADIWSFGITAIEMATGTAPYHKYPPMKVLMLTLQNEPPTLETGTDEKDQYKAYGKTFRKMISECLQKDPTKRPTSTELLKHPFFKKAKDKKGIIQSLVAMGPSMEKRSMKVKRQTDRASKPQVSEWVFSEDEEKENETAENSDEDEPAPDRPMNQLNINNSDSSGSDDDYASDDQSTEKPVGIVLRIRNPQNQLDDIRFDFSIGKDTAIGIAEELEIAGLINKVDVPMIAENLKRLISLRNEMITFRLPSADNYEVVDLKHLVGYAQISISKEGR